MAKKKRSYAELHHILGRHYRDNSYCGLIAVCLATNASPGKVKRYVEKFAKHWRLRPHGKGTPYEVISLALKRFGKEHDFNWDLFGYTGRTLNSVHRELAREYPDDTFHVYVKGHVACIREGILEDWTARTASRRKVTHVNRIINRES